MHVVRARCAGLDGHKKTVVVWARLLAPNGTLTTELRTFSTMDRGLVDPDGLVARPGRDPRVAMESGGEFWKPVPRKRRRPRLHPLPPLEVGVYIPRGRYMFWAIVPTLWLLLLGLRFLLPAGWRPAGTWLLVALMLIFDLVALVTIAATLR